jgi:hypothetical protein
MMGKAVPHLGLKAFWLASASAGMNVGLQAHRLFADCC